MLDTFSIPFPSSHAVNSLNKCITQCTSSSRSSHYSSRLVAHKGLVHLFFMIVIKFLVTIWPVAVNRIHEGVLLPACVGTATVIMITIGGCQLCKYRRHYWQGLWLRAKYQWQWSHSWWFFIRDRGFQIGIIYNLTQGCWWFVRCGHYQWIQPLYVNSQMYEIVSPIWLNTWPQPHIQRSIQAKWMVAKPCFPEKFSQIGW